MMMSTTSERIGIDPPYTVAMTGDELASWRKRYRLTQTELARRLGLNRVTVAEWEQSGEKPPKILRTRVIEFALAELARQLEAEQRGEVPVA